MSIASIEVSPRTLIVVAGEGNADTLPLAKSLREAGLSSICMSNCQTQMEHVHQLKPDLILLDAAIADEYYCDVGGRVRQDIPAIHIVSPDPASWVKAFAAGAVDCIVKPVVAEELLARVRLQLERRASQKLLDTSIASASAF